MLVKHVNSFLLIEEFCEIILLDKQGLKKLVQNNKFILYFDWLKYYDKLTDNDIHNICFKQIDTEYYLNLLVYKMHFIDFISAIKLLIKKEKEFFEDIAIELHLDTTYIDENHINSLVLVNDIYSVNDRYDEIFISEFSEKFLEIKKALNLIYKEFSTSYFSFKHSKNVDQVMTGINYGEKQIFERISFKKDDKEIVYLDTNVISSIMDSDSDKAKIIKSKENYHYCYSAYLLEDKIKQNLLFKIIVINLITELTNNLTVFRSGDYPKMQLDFAYEDPNVVYERVSLWLFQTVSAEDNNFNLMILNKIFYKKDEKVKSFSNEKMIEYLKYPDDNLMSLANFIGAAHAFDVDCSQLQRISCLIKLLNILEFKLDSSKSKIISSFQDEEHIQLASSSDYFITDDKKLIDRATVIYKVIGINTKVKAFKEFLKDLDV